MRLYLSSYRVPVYRAFTEVGVADLLHDGLHPNSAGHELLHGCVGDGLCRLIDAHGV